MARRCARVCRGAEVIEGRQLCRAELERFRKLAAGGAPLTVACTQEAPLFARGRRRERRRGRTELRQYPRNRRLVEGRQGRRAENGGADRGGGSSRCRTSPIVPLTSEGVTLIYGKDEQAIEAANLLKEHLDITVLIKPPADAAAAAA